MVQKRLNCVVFCEVDEKPSEEEGIEFWSCSKENGKIKSSFPAPNVRVEVSDEKENLNTSSPCFPNKFPVGDNYHQIVLLMLYKIHIT